MSVTDREKAIEKMIKGEIDNLPDVDFNGTILNKEQEEKAKKLIDLCTKLNGLDASVRVPSNKCPGAYVTINAKDFVNIEDKSTIKTLSEMMLLADEISAGIKLDDDGNYTDEFAVTFSVNDIWSEE